MLPKIEKILYATDLGPGSPLVFRYALSLAQQYGAKISITHAMEPLSPFGQKLVELHISHEETEQLHREARDKVKGDIHQRLELFCEQELGDDPEGRSRVSNIQVVEGNPAEVVLDEAEKQQADVIVMGTHHHTAVGEALIGSTAHKVVHRSQIPVLLVRVPKKVKEEGV